MVKIEYSGKSKQQLQLNCNTTVLNRIREYFSAPNPAFRRNSRFSQPRIYAITPSGKFDFGMLDNILSFLQANQIQYKIDDEVSKNLNFNFVDKKIETFEPDYVYRDHQLKSIEKALKKGSGVILIPTAGGKTLIMAGLIKSIHAHIQNNDGITLVLVPTIQLVEQTYNDFVTYGIENISKWSGKNKLDPTTKIIIAGTQILLSDNTDLSFLNNVNVLLIDECHGIKKENEINKIFKFINTPYKYGFTGTMPSTKIDEWNIIGKLGPIVYQEKTEDLRNKKYISNFKIVILNVIHKNIPTFSLNFSKPAEAYQSEMDFLLQSERRNEIICKLADKLTNNTIIMVDRIDHGINIIDILSKITKKQFYFIRGSTEIEEREQIRSLMDVKNDVIVVAISKIFSTGINIPNLHNIIFASAGKAKIKIMQSIGRALRLHPTKTMANIFDISDNTKYGKKHVKERKNLYDSEKFNYEEKNIQ
jgi:superfamily II DNA or RNA helicase